MSRDKRATVIDLCEGPAHGRRLELEPRNATIYVDGAKYQRMGSVTRHPDDGGPIGQCYLWADYWPTRLAAKTPCPTACDADCEADCHESHEVRSKQQHEPGACAGARRAADRRRPAAHAGA